MVEGGSFAWLNSQIAVVGRGIRTVEMSPDDNSWIVNGLAVRPGRVIMPEGISERTRDALEGHGVEIVTLPYDKVQLNGGGIHCSTCPLIRDRVA